MSLNINDAIKEGEVDSVVIFNRGEEWRLYLYNEFNRELLTQDYQTLDDAYKTVRLLGFKGMIQIDG